MAYTKQKPNALDAQRLRALKNLEELALTAIDDTPAISSKFQEVRNSWWRQWEIYARNILQLDDPDDIWIQLCQHNPHAQRICQSFLIHYVENATEYRVALGPEERVECRLVQSTVTMLEVWKGLVQEVDARVLKRKRSEDRQNRLTWTLRWSNGAERGNGPVYEISLWITNELTEKYQLTRKQTFTKVEATSEDIMVVLRELWTRAEDIPCSPSERHAFHGTVLLGGLGFRPQCIAEFPYNQVAIAVVRHPENRSLREIVAKIKIIQNKQRTNKVYKKQNDTLSFYVRFVPCQAICLLTLILARALHDNAFETPFASFAEILQRPNLEDVDYISLKWKPEFEKKKIFPLTYHRYWELWTRTWFVAGSRNNVRPYSMRVGAGGRLDGPLTPAVRNYVLSHSTNTFENSYQPHLVREDLFSVAFGVPPGDTSALFDQLCRSTLQRDKNAPIYPTPEDLRSFEQRRDVQELRAQQAASKKCSGNSKETQRITSKIQSLIRTCSRLAVERDRKAYFDEVDRLRASGISTINLPVVSPNPVRHVHLKSVTAAVHIGRLLHPGDRPPEVTQTVGGLLVSFLASRFAEVEERAPTMDPPPDTETGSRCLLCPAEAMVTFSRRSNLSRHHASQHLARSFQQVFPCPECRQQGMEDYYVDGPQDWSSHVERVHGLIHTPTLRQPTPGKQPKSSKERSARCLLCEMSLFPGGSFSRHVNKTHSVLFEEPFPCPECNRGGVEKVITSFSAWLDHTSSVHGHDGKTGDLIPWDAIPPREAKRKRKLEAFARDGDVIKPTVKRRPATERMCDDELIDPILIATHRS
ncbi:Protein of unknown function (DUF3435) domain containing protein [Rhypophila decipiens]